MNWSDDAVRKARNAGYAAAPTGAHLGEMDDAVILAVMDSAADILAARGGTMTADGVDRAMTTILHGGGPQISAELREHVAVQGARIAALERHVTELEGDLTRLQNEAQQGHLTPDLYRTNGGRGAAEAVSGQMSAATSQIMELTQYISGMEKSLARADTERDEHEAMGNKCIAELRARQRDIDEARNARSDAERERDQHKQSAELWRKRVEAAADALADVLPGEVGRLDLLARITELKRHRAEAMEKIQSALSERDEAVADSAALLEAGSELLECVVGVMPHAERERRRYAAMDILDAKHPGAALLERLKRMEEALGSTVADLSDDLAEPFWPASEDGFPRGPGAMLRGRTLRLLWGLLREGVTYSAPIVLIKPAYTAIITGITEPTCADGSCTKCRSGEPCH